MASGSSSDAQEEKTALVEADAEQDAGSQGLCVKQKEPKLTLYHWTQSFNSQKVSVLRVQHHLGPGQLPSLLGETVPSHVRIAGFVNDLRVVAFCVLQCVVRKRIRTHCPREGLLWSSSLHNVPDAMSTSC